jgi:hypothetical protein
MPFGMPGNFVAFLDSYAAINLNMQIHLQAGTMKP